MKKRCLALVTLMVMLASMVLPCAAMAEGRDGYVFYAPVGTIIHDTYLVLPLEYRVSDRECGSGGSSLSYYINYRVLDDAWDENKIVTSGEYTYYLLDDGTIALIAMDQTYQSKKVVVPQTIDGYTVTRLGLDRNVAVMKVTYQDATNHDYWNNEDRYLLFGNNVEEVVLPESVKVIGYKALTTKSNGRVSKLTAPGVTEIGGAPFATVLYKLPANIEKIGMFAFGDADMKGENNQLKLPETLVEIGACAFMGSALKSVTIPGSVQEIGPYAFAGCAWRLQTVTLKNGVPYISDGMFMNCEKLKQISLPESIASVGAYAFENCEKLSKVTFAKKAQVASIGEGAFRGCAALKSVVIPEGVTEIGDVAFFDCSALSAVTLPDSLTSIGAHAFDGCSSKVKFTVVDGSYAHQWATDNGFATKVQKRK